MSINVIGITGPSGAGKSFVCTYLAKRNVPVIDADEVYHSLLTKNSPTTLALAREFGEEIIGIDGTPDRKKLGAIVFSSDEKLQKLNSIVLGFVIDKINLIIADLSASGEKNVAVDAPTLIESGFANECDYVVSILAPKEERIKRICERDGIPTERATLRIEAQKNDDFYKNNSDHILINDADEDTFYKKAEELFNSLIVA